jgi:hypothetical protein
MARAWPVRGLKPEMSLRQAARRVLAVRIAEFYSYAPFIHDPARVTELHDMRIAAKRLRYTLEIFRVALSDSANDTIEQVKEIQELLGQIHDADVLADIVEERLTTIDHETRQSLRAHLHDEPDEKTRLAAIKERLQPAEQDRRVGLYALLGRTLHRRRRRYADFLDLWARLETRRFRGELEALTQPAASAPAAGAPAA